jgi:four helix bundle protein
VTNGFLKSELYGITDQMRRAIITIPSNIAEEVARQTKKNFNQFLNIALVSISEFETLIICQRLIFINKDKLNRLNKELIEIRKMLFGLKNQIN